MSVGAVETFSEKLQAYMDRSTLRVAKIERLARLAALEEAAEIAERAIPGHYACQVAAAAIRRALEAPADAEAK